jgi:DNA-binding PadR family transcriptional regulator
MYTCYVKELSKELMASSLAPLVMLVLKQGESYGYEIIQQLKKKTHGQLAVAEGTLYPVLKKMEAKKFVKATWKKADTGRERRYYSLTAKGNQQMQEQFSQWNFINEIIQNLWKQQVSTLGNQLTVISIP